MCILLNMCTDMHLQSFMISGKLKILQQAEETGNHASNKKYNFSECYIRDSRERQKLALHYSNCLRTFCGHKVKCPKKMRS